MSGPTELSRGGLPAVSAVDWAAVVSEPVQADVTRQVVQGERQTVVRYLYQPGAIFPEHAHPQEQATIVVRGRIEFAIAGETMLLGPGDVVIIPGQVRHGARVVGDEVVESINVLSPRRDTQPNPAT